MSFIIAEHTNTQMVCSYEKQQNTAPDIETLLACKESSVDNSLRPLQLLNKALGKKSLHVKEIALPSFE